MESSIIKASAKRIFVWNPFDNVILEFKGMSGKQQIYNLETKFTGAVAPIFYDHEFSQMRYKLC